MNKFNVIDPIADELYSRKDQQPKKYGARKEGEVTPIFKAPELPGTDARDGTDSTRALSELGNSKRLLDAHKENVRYVYEVNEWMCWRNDSWNWDIGGAFVRSLAAELPAQIYREGADYLADAELFAKWARTSQKERTIDAAISLLKNFEQIRIPLKVLDADIFKIGLNNGCSVIDLRSGEARPTQRSDFITKSLNVSRLGDSSKAGRWLSFLDEVFEGDAELIDWLKRWCGYLLTGSTSEQIFVFCHGCGRNGKSVFAEILNFILGDYARTVAVETLTESKRQGGSASPDLASLVGARLAMSSETEEGVALAESLIKLMTGGDAISARKLYGDQFNFLPQFKLMMMGNHKPIIKGTDYGIWRRVMLIPFNRQFKGNNDDPSLKEKLKDEAQHILAWMVEGCLEWQKRGLRDIPASVKQATDDYKEDQDLTGRWIAECCELSAIHETSTTDLYASYEEWCKANGMRALTSISLGRRLAERGLNSRRSHGKTLWSGISARKNDLADAYRTAKGW